MDSSAQARQSAPKAGCTALNEELDGVQSECTIYRVHRHLRGVNSNAYEPEVIAIGPYHRNKKHLKMMEEHKLRNLQLLKKVRGCNIDEMYDAVKKLEKKARRCYADQPTGLIDSEFIHMLVLDGCFIAELVWKFTNDSAGLKNDPIFRMDWMMTSLKRDLMLFENQVPFFILCELFDLINYQGITRTLPELLLNFFRYCYPGQWMMPGTMVLQEMQETTHVLDLIYRSWFRGSDWDITMSELTFQENEEATFIFIDCASGLRETNVKFQKNEEATLLDISFRDGVLCMAPLVIQDGTESLLKNLIAYEQYSGRNQPNIVTDYVTFLACLINSAKDVELLKQYEIITNIQGDDKVVAKMVNKLCDSVVGPSDGFFYGEICKEVRRHCRKRRNRWVKRRERWRAKASIAAAVLLLLTVIQTVFSILQVVLKK